MIFNGIILFSVIHPGSLRRTVFLIERDAKARKAFHLHIPESQLIVKRMAYERGVLVMLLGPDRKGITHAYKKVVALDILHGAQTEWDINEEAFDANTLQARGLQFMLNETYIQILVR